MRYSPKESGFYPEDIDYGDSLPDDVITISQELYLSLLSGQSQGQIITPGKNGVPYLASPPEKTQEQNIADAENERNRLFQQINTKTQLWQTQLALGIITDKDKSTLTTWMRYAQQVQAVDTSKAPDVTWPTQPA